MLPGPLIIKWVPSYVINPLNAELIPICHLLTLLGARHIRHFSRIRVKRLASRRVHHRRDGQNIEAVVEGT